MDIREFFEKEGGSYDEVMGRLGKEERIIKYLKKFAEGEDYRVELKNALENEDYETAFRTVHNLKGLSLNLGLKKLHDTSDILCEEIRHGKPDKDISDMVDAVMDAYTFELGLIGVLD